MYRRSELDEAMPTCARAIFERRREAGRIMLATEGSWQGSQDARRHDEDAIHNWENEGGSFNG
jgi:hypothetical protein